MLYPCQSLTTRSSIVHLSVKSHGLVSLPLDWAGGSVVTAAVGEGNAVIVLLLSTADMGLDQNRKKARRPICIVEVNFNVHEPITSDRANREVEDVILIASCRI